MLASLLRPDAGEIRIGDIDPVADPAGVRKVIGWMPDALGAWPSLTARETLVVTAKLYRIPADQAAERAVDPARHGRARRPRRRARPGALARSEAAPGPGARPRARPVRAAARRAGLGPGPRGAHPPAHAAAGAGGRWPHDPDLEPRAVGTRRTRRRRGVHGARRDGERRPRRRGIHSIARVAHQDRRRVRGGRPQRRRRGAARAADAPRSPRCRRAVRLGGRRRPGLAALVAAGIAVSEFAPVTGDLEHTFLDLGARGGDQA